jgi:hypothetical protein
VAFGRSGERSFAELTADTAALAAAIERVGAGRWLLDTESAYAAAVGLLALAQTGSVAVLPTNRQPETLQRLRPALVGGLIDPARDAGALAGLPRLDPLAQPPAPARTRRIDRDAPFAELETSGTTGEGRWVAKALRHLEDEVEALEAAFGARLPGGTRVFATVPHQHIYGLLFRSSGARHRTAVSRPPHPGLSAHIDCVTPVVTLVTCGAWRRRKAWRGWRPSAARSSPREAPWTRRPRRASRGSWAKRRSRSWAPPRRAASRCVSARAGGISSRRCPACASVGPGRRAGGDLPFVSVGLLTHPESVGSDGRSRSQAGGSLHLGRSIAGEDRRGRLLPRWRRTRAAPAVAEAALLVLPLEPRVHAAVAPAISATA